jgi:hypothetical protein
LAEDFFSQIAILYGIHPIDAFLQDKLEYDPTDFTDAGFMELLENR